LKQNVPPGEWVLDPFGASPRLILEAAQAGYRVLVAASNPISRVMVELAANPPSEDDLRLALSELAAAHKGDERLEPHIKGLYVTECSHCGQPVDADYFVWERQAPAPYAKSYHCLHCGDTGERSTNEADTRRAAMFSGGGLHRARALERIAGRDDPDRVHVEEALEVYLPRAVYAVFTLINKLDGLTLSPLRRTHLAALLLTACDQANTLWPYPTGRERPRQLTVPPKFRENNIWQAMEQGIDQWATSGSAKLAVWPNPLDEGPGVSLYEGRLKELIANLPQVDVRAVVTAMPRPNQAFWTLSALWAGWLWGREAVGPFKTVLRRRRYDWAWHTAALSAALGSLYTTLSPETPFFGLIAEAEPGFLSSVLIAAERSGFDMVGLAVRADEDHAQITWKRAAQKAPAAAVEEIVAAGKAIQAAKRFLADRSQPAGYLPLHAAALQDLAQNHCFQILDKKTGPAQPAESAFDLTPAENFSQVQAVIKDAFTFREGFTRYEGSEQSLDVGQWWLRTVKETQRPLADRVEMALVRILNKHPGDSFLGLDAALCVEFPGLMTPDHALARVCLDSYGMQDPPGSERWRLRIEDIPATRRRDLNTTRDMIMQLGKQLGFEPALSEHPSPQPGSTAIPYLWKEPGGTIRYAFFVIASAAIGGIVLGLDFPILSLIPASENMAPKSQRPVLAIVLPGGRANLVAFKLRNDPNLRQQVTLGWRFLKYRHLRQLIESPVLNRDTLDEQLGLDPLTYNAPQMRLL